MALASFGSALGAPPTAGSAAGPRRVLVAALPFVADPVVERRRPPAVLRHRRWRRVLLLGGRRRVAAWRLALCRRLRHQATRRLPHLCDRAGAFRRLLRHHQGDGDRRRGGRCRSALRHAALRRSGPHGRVVRGAVPRLYARLRRHRRRQHAASVAVRHRQLRRRRRRDQRRCDARPALRRCSPRRARHRIGRHDQADRRLRGGGRLRHARRLWRAGRRGCGCWRSSSSARRCRRLPSRPISSRSAISARWSTRLWCWRCTASSRR